MCKCPEAGMDRDREAGGQGPRKQGGNIESELREWVGDTPRALQATVRILDSA